MQKSLLTTLLLTMLFAALPVFAKECKGMNFPDQIQLDGTRLQLNGLGLRQATIFKINVYVAGLYLENKTGNADEIINSNKPRRLVLQFLLDVGLADITQGWSEAFEANAGSALASLQDRIATLNSWMTDIKTDDRLVFTYKPGAGVQVETGGTVKGTIKGDDFARALFSIWLGIYPETEGLKAGLLGGSCG
jgi:hypothetical protein